MTTAVLRYDHTYDITAVQIYLHAVAHRLQLRLSRYTSIGTQRDLGSQLTRDTDPQGDREGGQGHFLQLQRATAWWCTSSHSHLSTTRADVLQASIDAHGIPLTDEALSAAKSADAVLLGAIGGPVRFPKNMAAMV